MKIYSYLKEVRIINRNLFKTVLLVFSIIFLAGCSLSDSSSNKIEIIENAATKNTELNSARFETSLSREHMGDQYTENSEGTFIKLADGTYNWYQKNFFNDEQSVEMTQSDGKEYVKVNNGENSESPWGESETLQTSLSDVLRSLFEINLVEADIDEVSVHTETDKNRYTITTTTNYPERIKNETLQPLQKRLEELKQENTQKEFIQGMEAQIQLIEETQYLENILTYEIDKEGYLTDFTYKATVSQKNGAYFNFITSTSITEYNLNDTSHLLPSIDD